MRWLKGVYEGYRDRTISSPPILVYYPNGSEQLKEGNTYSIMWDSDSISGNVKIDLYENNVFRQTIAADTLNDRTYEWTVPANLSGSTFHIRISSVSDGTKFDESDGFFTITETIFNDPLNTNSGFTTTSR